MPTINFYSDGPVRYPVWRWSIAIGWDDRRTPILGVAGWLLAAYACADLHITRAFDPSGHERKDIRLDKLPESDSRRTATQRTFRF
jgi:hypothetical protein